MKVKDLIELLKQKDPEDAIMVDGYEYGVQDGFTVSSKRVELYYWGRDACYGGEHEVVDGTVKDDRVVVDAVVFSRA